MINRAKTAKFLIFVVFLLLADIVLLASAAHVAKVQEGSNLVFILDASGSMWGQVDNKAKIEIAKEVLIGLIQDLPAQGNVGLVAYGHRRKGDCNDVEELVPLGSINKDVLIKKIQAINPKGKTPITLSVQKTAEKLKAVEEETTIILVSDGKETCEGDPCALVKELKESGVKFVMHVIGFDVTEEERSQLKCIAEAGGGIYYTAKTASDFKVAAKKAVEEAQKWGFLKVTAVRDDKPFQAAVEVYSSGGKERVMLTSTVTKADESGTKLMPGAYDIKVIDQEIESQPTVSIAGIEIEAGKTVEKKADFSGGTLVITALLNDKPIAVKVVVCENEKNKEVASTNFEDENPKLTRLLPGTYDVTVKDIWKMQQEPEETFTGVLIEPGGKVEKTVEFSAGYLKVTTLKNGKPFDASVYVYNPETSTRVASSDTSVDNPVTIWLLPGVYNLKVIDSWGSEESREFKGISIETEETQDIKAAF